MKDILKKNHVATAASAVQKKAKPSPLILKARLATSFSLAHFFYLSLFPRRSQLPTGAAPFHAPNTKR